MILRFLIRIGCSHNFLKFFFSDFDSLRQLIHHVPLVYRDTTCGWFDGNRNLPFVKQFFYKVDTLKIHYKPILRQFFASQWKTRDICASEIEIDTSKFKDQDRHDVMKILSASCRLENLKVIVKADRNELPDLNWFLDIVKVRGHLRDHILFHTY